MNCEVENVTLSTHGTRTIHCKCGKKFVSEAEEFAIGLNIYLNHVIHPLECSLRDATMEVEDAKSYARKLEVDSKIDIETVSTLNKDNLNLSDEIDNLKTTVTENMKIISELSDSISYLAKLRNYELEKL